MIDPNKVILDGEQSDAIIVAQATEIARLKEAIRRLAEQDATLSVCGGNVKVTMDATLTDEERDALAKGIYLCEGTAGEANENINGRVWAQVAARLRGLLERAK